MGKLILPDTEATQNLDEEQVLEELDKISTYEKNRELYYAVNDENLWRLNQTLRNSKHRGKDIRKIATIPTVLATALERKYGPEVFRDKKLFKQALAREELLRWGLTVPQNSL